ncbi:9893_t:CDS:2 [Cetraspora pellucida]|uniref:9893_t:CDS:1 n=1 Tax=Cetraspora pellucida TaxID=1433469 RepID=A0A9N9CJB4_9GLOM|nr:9893_t:CDS:2 [Cetraspora pellucida]
MTDTQFTIILLKELNTKLTFEISELRKKYANLEFENTKLKQDKEEVEVRFLNLEQRDREKTDLIAKLKHDVLLIKDPAGTSSKLLEDNIFTSNIFDNTSNNGENCKKETPRTETLSTSENNTPNISCKQDLIQEISTSIKEQAQNSETQDIFCLYQNACDAEKDAIEANQKEILCWCFYAKRFKSMIKDFIINDRIGEKKTKGRVYNFIIKQLPATKRGNLCKQTQKALRIDNLFKKIRMCKVQYIKTYSVNIISRFTNLQIQMIIDYFTKKSDIEYTDDQDNSSDDLPEAELSEEAKKTLPGTEISVLPEKVLPEIEILNTKANDSKPQSLITALSDDEPENFSDDDNSFNNNEDDGKVSYCDIFYNLVPELEKKIDELKNKNIKIKTENTKLKYDKEEVETENIKLKQNLDEFKKELESKKNRKF